MLILLTLEKGEIKNKKMKKKDEIIMENKVKNLDIVDLMKIISSTYYLEDIQDYSLIELEEISEYIDNLRTVIFAELDKRNISDEEIQEEKWARRM